MLIVLSMHTNSGARGATYEPIASASSIGYPTNLSVLMFAPSHGHTFTSSACQSLDCATILRLDRTHVLFSLPNTHLFRRQDVSENVAHPVTLITLDDLTANLISLMQQQIVRVKEAVGSLGIAIKATKAARAPQPKAGA